MCTAISPPPNTSSWHGAPFKKAQGQLYLYLTSITTVLQIRNWERQSRSNLLTNHWSTTWRWVSWKLIVT